MLYLVVSVTVLNNIVLPITHLIFQLIVAILPEVQQLYHLQILAENSLPTSTHHPVSLLCFHMSSSPIKQC